MLGIYKITNKVNGKMYIGESMDIERRWEEHVHDLNNNLHHSWKLQYDWNKYGSENFEHSVLMCIDGYKTAFVCKCFMIILENSYIEKFNTIECGYNVENTLEQILCTQKFSMSDGSENNCFDMFYPIYKRLMSKHMLNNNEEFITTGFVKYSYVYKNRKIRRLDKAIISACKLIGIRKGVCANSVIKNKVFMTDKLNSMMKVINGDVYINKYYMEEVKRNWIYKNISIKDNPYYNNPELLSL